MQSITKTIFLVVMTIKVTSGKASGGNRFCILLRICVTCTAAVQVNRSTFNCFRNKHESEQERGHNLRRLNLWKSFPKRRSNFSFGCYAVSLGKCPPMSWRIILPSSSVSSSRKNYVFRSRVTVSFNSSLRMFTSDNIESNNSAWLTQRMCKEAVAI
jgi:hypothetical protein